MATTYKSKANICTQTQAMKKKKECDHRLRNSAQYERVVELLIMHKAKRTPIHFRDLGHETDGNNKICLGVRIALCIPRLQRFLSCERKVTFRNDQFCSQLFITNTCKQVTAGGYFVYN